MEKNSGSMKLQVFRDELESHKHELTVAAEGLITKRSDLCIPYSVYRIMYSVFLSMI